MCVDRRCQSLVTEEVTVAVDIVRDQDTYSFFLKETAERLCTIEPRHAASEAIRLWDELWGHTGGGFRPFGSEIGDHRTIKTVKVRPPQVNSLRSLAKVAR